MLQNEGLVRSQVLTKRGSKTASRQRFCIVAADLKQIAGGAGRIQSVRCILDVIHAKDFHAVLRYDLRVGQQAREANAEMLLSPSARGAGKNVAVFTDGVFASEPKNQWLWLSQVRADRVMFRGKQGFFQFSVNDYLTKNGELARIRA
ncbi:MAG: hypothetical protein AAF098_19610 [Pseudomonadota bacterium]